MINDKILNTNDYTQETYHEVLPAMLSEFGGKSFVNYGNILQQAISKYILIRTFRKIRVHDTIRTYVTNSLQILNRKERYS